MGTLRWSLRGDKSQLPVGDRLASDVPLTVAVVCDALGTSRRHAEAILRHWNHARSEQ
jgi:hypothetical protein